MAFNLNNTEINKLMNKEILLIYIYLTNLQYHAII